MAKKRISEVKEIEILEKINGSSLMVYLDIIKNLMEEYGEMTRLTIDAGYSNVSYIIDYSRKETDEEKDQRLVREKIAKEGLRQQRLIEKGKRLESYLKLKQEFEVVK